jgi:uridine kinase
MIVVDHDYDELKVMRRSSSYNADHVSVVVINGCLAYNGGQLTNLMDEWV